MGPAVMLMGWAAACGVSKVDYTGKSCASGACPAGWVCRSPERVCVRPGNGAAGLLDSAGAMGLSGDGAGETAGVVAGGAPGVSRGGEPGAGGSKGGKGGGGHPAGGSTNHGGSIVVGEGAGSGVAGEPVATAEGGTAGGSGTAGNTGTAGDTGAAGDAGTAGDIGEPPTTGPSCPALDMSCRGESCCVSLPVAGGDFTLGGTHVEYTSQATISSFYLDEYEVTAGRFRAFVANYDAWRADGNPTQNAGAHPRIAGSGWQAVWNDELPADAATLEGKGRDCYGYPTWPDITDPSLPADCVTWFTAFAFCIWDGGRLPTQAEWEYAAAGGSEGRVRPWSSTLPPPFSRYAVYGCLGDGDQGAACSFADILPVGSRPDGAGRWGQQDLAGSMWEWALDQYTEIYPARCRDCANVTDGGLRVLRGGSWLEADKQFLEAAFSNNTIPQGAYDNVGFRCAR